MQSVLGLDERASSTAVISSPRTTIVLMDLEVDDERDNLGGFGRGLRANQVSLAGMDTAILSIRFQEATTHNHARGMRDGALPR